MVEYLFFISNDLQSRQLHNLTLFNDNIEINTVNITFKYISYIICAIYKPHSQHEFLEEFINDISTLLHNDTVKKKKKNDSHR